MPDDTPRSLAVYPVLSYATALTSQAMCIIEIQVQAPDPVRADQGIAIRFRLERSDAAALGRALLETADLASRLATNSSLSNGQH